MGHATKAQIEGDKAMPMLDRQPPLPNTAPMRILSQDDDYYLGKKFSSNDALYRRPNFLTKGRNVRSLKRESSCSELLGWIIQYALEHSLVYSSSSKGKNALSP